VQALRALGELPAVRVELRKRIPVQAGLGGGSSDAATALLGAMAGAFGPQPKRDWLRVARALGSDVPFFLAQTAALVEGTGERVTPAGALPRWHVLIVKPPAAIATSSAYNALDRHERPQRGRSGSVSIAMLEALQRADFARVASLLQNDFHDLIVSQTPVIAKAAAALETAGAANVLLAGSGSCLFTLAPERESLDAIATRLDLERGCDSFVTSFASTPQWRPSTRSE
jgi:4-diphosphocytidyl-2-C-methyl-D-erythritol kinase